MKFSLLEMAMKPLCCLLLVLSTLLLTSCASTGVSDLYEFYEIESANNSKLFEYRFIVDPNQRRPETSKKPAPRGGVVSFGHMRQELKKYMEAFPYCTEGYFVYDESFDGQEYKLLGECQESK